MSLLSRCNLGTCSICHLLLVNSLPFSLVATARTAGSYTLFSAADADVVLSIDCDASWRGSAHLRMLNRAHFPLNTWRNDNVVITSKRRHFDVITSKWLRFNVITTSLLRIVSGGFAVADQTPFCKIWSLEAQRLGIKCLYRVKFLVDISTTNNIVKLSTLIPMRPANGSFNSGKILRKDVLLGIKDPAFFVVHGGSTDSRLDGGVMEECGWVDVTRTSASLHRSEQRSSGSNVTYTSASLHKSMKRPSRS